MRIVGGTVPPTALFNGGYLFGVALAYCGRCANPLAVKVHNTQRRTNDSIGLAIDLWTQPTHRTDTPEQHNLRVELSFAPQVGGALPDHLSERVARALRQAEDNYRREGSEEASATMYRRAIDLALKDLFPDLGGDLMPRILKLVKDGSLPSTMGDWGHQVRIIGNDGAHDLEGVSRNDLDAARAFCDAFLRYLFTLPKEVELRREQTAPKG